MQSTFFHKLALRFVNSCSFLSEIFFCHETMLLHSKNSLPLNNFPIKHLLSKYVYLHVIFMYLLDCLHRSIGQQANVWKVLSLSNVPLVFKHVELFTRQINTSVLLPTVIDTWANRWNDLYIWSCKSPVDTLYSSYQVIMDESEIGVTLSKGATRPLSPWTPPGVFSLPSTRR